MQRLEQLVAEAEASRVLQICNACRYCEGFCAVFPAMTRRLEFPHADVHYLANLCHHCGACLHACQYAPPHEFAVNLPQALARVRARTYRDHAWPAGFARLYERNGLTVALALAFSLAAVLIAGLWRTGALWHEPLAGNFYAVFPHPLMVAVFAPVFLFALLALGLGVRRFWRGMPDAGAVTGAAAAQAAHDAFRLKYLDGGHGQGCNNADDAWTPWRRRFHHATFYGFLLCFASTALATLYHYAFGWQAPYAMNSGPVLLGTVGGLGLLVGPTGQYLLHRRRHAQQADAAQAMMDRAFIGLLFGTGATGLALLALRHTGAMALLLALHLGFVMALFLTLPYGKFAHGAYRAAAVLRFQMERRRPSRLRLGAD